MIIILFYQKVLTSLHPPDYSAGVIKLIKVKSFIVKMKFKSKILAHIAIRNIFCKVLA